MINPPIVKRQNSKFLALIACILFLAVGLVSGGDYLLVSESETDCSCADQRFGEDSVVTGDDGLLGTKVDSTPSVTFLPPEKSELPND